MAEFQQNLWAPWRMEYIAGLREQSDGCFLCDAIGQPAGDDARYVLWRGPQTITLLNLYPYSSGHVLVAPLTHVGRLEDLPDAVLLESLQRTRDAQRVLQASLGAQGFNIGLNLGRCAGAGLPDHLHLHVVPRWSGDVNFMAVLGDVKVIPEALATVRRLFLAKAAELGLPATT
jgi:ATP adenylyltransferase